MEGQPGMKFKQFSISHEWNQEKENLDILVLIQDEEGVFHQYLKHIPYNQLRMPLGTPTEATGEFK